MDCEFNLGSSVSVLSGGELGSITQSSYNPSGSSFINNSGNINAINVGINIDDSYLSNGLSNRGVIVSTNDSGILINNSSGISGGISNSGSIISENNMGLQLDNGSTINGNINNSGSIISNSINNPALLIRNNTTINGDVINSGTIRTFGDANAFHMSDSSLINGNIINSGSIRGASGLDFRVLTNVSGNITNSGTIIGDTNNGINLTQTAQVSGNIINSGNITGGTNGISIDDSTIGGIINQAGATIHGGDYGIFTDFNATISSGITNHGNISGDVNAIYISSDSTVNNINIYDGSTITGNIDAVNSTVNIIDGGEINGATSVNLFNINSGAAFTMNNTITANSVTNNGELIVGNTTRTIVGAYTQSTGGVLKLDAQNTSTYGQLSSTSDMDFSQSGAIDVNIIGTDLRIGNTLSNVIFALSLTPPTDGFNVTDNSRLLNFSAELNGGHNAVNLIAVDDASTSVALSNSALGNKGGAGVAAKLDEIIALNPSGDWQNVIGAFNHLSSDQEIKDATNQTTPALNGATNSAIIETMNTALRIVQARQKSNSGFSSGEDFSTKNNLWIKAFGSWGNQGNKDGVVGYDSNAYGFITGADQDVSDKTRLGVSVSYFNSKLTSNNSNNLVNVDSFLGIAYGSYNLDEKTEVNAQIAAGYNRSNSSRYINFGGLNRVAKAGYDGWNFHAGTGVSHLVKLDRDTTIAPQIRLDYFNVGNGSYSESGAGALNLNVASQMQAQLIPAFEVKADHKFNNVFSLSVNGGLGYDLLHNHNSVSASFDSGGEFITRGLAPSPWVVRSGVGLVWKQSDEMDFSLRYDRRDRGSYDNQTVSLKLRRMF